MRKLVVLGSLALVSVAALAQAPPPPMSEHTAVNANALKWGAPPPAFEKGAALAVVSGDPGKPGPFVVRLRMPQGYVIRPHFHPTDENVTVMAGEFAIGMGDKVEKGQMKTLTQGGFTLLPAQMHHYATAVTASVVQVHGVGPFTLTYVNPADDPRTRTGGTPK